MKSVNVPYSATKYGIQESGYEKTSNQHLVDQFGFFYGRNAIDLKSNAEAINALHSDLDSLSQLLRQRVPMQSRVVLRFPLCVFTLNLFQDVTQVVANRFAPILPSYVSLFLTEQELYALPERRKICGKLPYPQIDIGELKSKERSDPTRPLSKVEKAVLTPEFFTLFEKVFNNSTSLIHQLASKDAREVLLVQYEPLAALHQAELPIGSDGSGHHHYDRNENAVTRVIGLVGDMHCHIGTTDENSVHVVRQEGDEVIMNYLSEGFGAKQPFHDFTNKTLGKTLSLVIDEPPYRGLDLLNRFGVYSRNQFAAISF